MTSLLKESVITLGSRGVYLVLAMATSVIVSRVLGPSLKGSYSLLLMVVTVANMLALAGMGSANVYLGSRDRTRLPALAANSFLHALVAGGAGIVLVHIAIALPFVHDYFAKNGVDPAWVRGFAFILPIVLLSAMMREIVRAGGRIVRYNSIVVVRGAAETAGAVVFVWLMDGLLAGAVSMWVTAELVGCAWVLWSALGVAGRKLRTDPTLWKQTLSFGTRIHAGHAAQFLNYRLDMLIIGWLLPQSQIGLYVTATALSKLLWELPHAVRTALIPRVAASAGSDAANLTTARACRLVGLLVGLVCATIALLRDPLIAMLYGDAFQPSALVLALLMPGTWALGFGKLMSVHLSAIGRPMVGTWAALIALVVTVILDLLWIPRFGILGAAAASSMAYTALTVVVMVVFLRATKLRVTDVLFVKREDLQLLRNAWARRGKR